MREIKLDRLCRTKDFSTTEWHIEFDNASSGKFPLCTTVFFIFSILEFNHL